jgi:homoserine kinase
LLPALLPLAAHYGVMSVTLSGAGPAVLLLTQEQEGSQEEALKAAILDLARPVCPVEILTARLCRGSAQIHLG